LHVQVERHIRRQIQTGIWKPGKRLPTTDQLIQGWEVSRLTLQKAMENLVAEGLIERKRNRGTFVRNTNEQAMLGILVGPNLMHEVEYFLRAVVKFIRMELSENSDYPWTAEVYDGWVTEKHGYPPALAQRFKNDLQNYSFKAVIGLGLPLKKILEDFPHINRVPHAQLNFTWQEGGSDVILDYYQFGRECAEWIVRNGFQKIIYLRTLDMTPHGTQDLAGINSVIQPPGHPAMEVIQLPYNPADCATLEEKAFQKTMAMIDEWAVNEESRRQPTALLISDDIVTRGVAFAFAEKGIMTPKNIKIITMANEGIRHPYAMPVARYEFSPQMTAQKLLEILKIRIKSAASTAAPFKLSGRLINPS